MYTFLLHLSAMLVLAEGGDKVRANERRQAIWHSLCRHRQMTMNDLVAEYKTCQATLLGDISVLSLSYDNDSTRRTDLRKSCTHA